MGVRHGAAAGATPGTRQTGAPAITGRRRTTTGFYLLTGPRWTRSAGRDERVGRREHHDTQSGRRAGPVSSAATTLPAAGRPDPAGGEPAGRTPAPAAGDPARGGATAAGGNPATTGGDAPRPGGQSAAGRPTPGWGWPASRDAAGAVYRQSRSRDAAVWSERGPPAGGRTAPPAVAPATPTERATGAGGELPVAVATGRVGTARTARPGTGRSARRR